mmetsp:Transcript_30512/g.52938  ORF Transcript_30512/g.52938 Transcript_30512/m.52938 type:complete len:95 (-) Transcript_30512:62-346(-)
MATGDETSSGMKSSSRSVLNSRKNSSFSCMPPSRCYSKYQTDDKVEPIPIDVVSQSLSRMVPNVLACISFSPPTASRPHGKGEGIQSWASSKEH